MAYDQHDHDRFELSETQLRVRALETVLTEKGYVDPAALDLLMWTYETKVGPRNGARVVAKAWTDPAYRARLFKEATSAIAELGYAGRQGEHVVALENTPKRHGRVYAVFVLPVAGARPAAGLVQVRTLPFARGCRSARRAQGCRHHSAEGHRNPGGAFAPGDPLLVSANAPPRHRRLERRQACRTGHARFHDRRRPAEIAERCEMNGGQDIGGMDGFGPVPPGTHEPRLHTPR